MAFVALLALALPLTGCKDALEGTWEAGSGYPVRLELEWTSTPDPDAAQEYLLEGTWSYGELSGVFTGTAIEVEGSYPGHVTLSGLLIDLAGATAGTLHLADGYWSSAACSFWHGQLVCTPATIDGRVNVDGAIQLVETWFQAERTTT